MLPELYTLGAVIAILVGVLKPFLEKGLSPTNSLHDPFIQLLSFALGIMLKLGDYAVNAAVVTGPGVELNVEQGFTVGAFAIVNYHLVSKGLPVLSSVLGIGGTSSTDLGPPLRQNEPSPAHFAGAPFLAIAPPFTANPTHTTTLTVLPSAQNSVNYAPPVQVTPPPPLQFTPPVEPEPVAAHLA